MIPRILLILTLAAVTVTYQRAVWRYQDAAADVLQNADFSQGGAFWHAPRGAHVAVDTLLHGVVLQRDRDGGALPYILQPIRNIADHEHLRVRAEIRLENLRPGPAPWQRAVLALESFSSYGAKLKYWPHDIANLSGGDGWRTVERVLPVPKAATSMRLVAYMGAKQGRMTIRNISVRAMAETALSLWLGWALLASWLLVGVWCLAPLLRRPLITPVRDLLLFTGLAVLAGALTPQPQLGQTVAMAYKLSNTAAEAIQAAVRPERTAQSRPTAPAGDQATMPRGSLPNKIRTPAARAAQGASPPSVAPPGYMIGPTPGAEHLGHLIAYFLFSALVLVAYGRRSLTRVATGLALFAVTSEALQSFIVTRDAEWLDMAYNSAGIAGGCALVLTGGAIFDRLPWRKRSGFRANKFIT